MATGSLRRCLVTAVLLALLGLGVTAATSAAQTSGKKGGGFKIVFTGGFIYHSESIPPGATVSFKVTCPPPMTASSGTVSSGDPRVLTLLSTPAGATAWSFGFRNTDTKNAVTIVVVVTCVKPAGGLPPAFLVGLAKKLKKKSPATLGTVPPGSTQTLDQACPKGQTPVGDSVQSGGTPSPKSARLASVTDVGGVQVTSETLGRRVVSLGLRNPGPTGVTVGLGVNCLPKTVSFHGRQRSILVSRASFPETVGRNGSVVSGACPGQIPVSAGFSIPSGGQLSFLGTGFGLGTFNASWAFSNSTGQPQQAHVSLVCVPGKAKFAQGLPPSQTIDTLVGPITITG